MKNLILASVLAFGGISAANAGVDIQVNIGNAPYYGYAPRDVVYVERYVPEPYVPRVFILSRYAGVAPSVIVGRYRSGWGWDRICNHYRVPTRVIYEPAYVRPVPRGHAYGHYKHGKAFRHDKAFKNGYRR